MTKYSLGKEKEFFSENLAMLVKSGMPISEALESIQKDAKGKNAKKAISALVENIKNGMALSKGLGEINVFGERALSLIRIGEETGKLAENLQIVASQEAKEKKFASKIQSALLYPVFVLFVTLVVGIAITWLILPRLSKVFKQLDIKLPTITVVVLGVGDFLEKYGIIVVPIFIIILSLIVYFVFVYKKTKFIGDYIFFAIPGINSLIKNVEIARFGYLFGTLIQAGVPISKSLDLLVSSSYFPHYKKFYMHLRQKVIAGDSLYKSFSSYKKIYKLFPASTIKLISTSEQTSNLSKTLKKIGKIYENKTETILKNLSSMLEPILLIIIWFGVLFVALSVILPIYSLVGNLDQKQNSTGEGTIENTPSAKVILEVKPTIVKTPESKNAIISKKESVEIPIVKQIKIKPNTLGFLNVREEPTNTSNIIFKANTDEVFSFEIIENNYYKIKVDCEKTVCSNNVDFGYVQKDYVTDITSQ